MPEQPIAVPLKTVGPIRITTKSSKPAEDYFAPLATYEKPVWYAVGRGAKLSRHGSPIHTYCIADRMTRSIVFKCKNGQSALALKAKIQLQEQELKHLVSQTSRHAKLLNCQFIHLGNSLYCRFSFETGEAAGHNMVTKASDLIGQTIGSWPGDHRYISVSGNLCTDKKVSSINPIQGRGKHMLAEIIINRVQVEAILGTTPEAMIELHIAKNLTGSILAGSLHSANAHVANTLLAFYLATGQDAANIVEGSQAIVQCEMHDQDNLYFSVTLPSIIIGSVGQGKTLTCTQANIDRIHSKITASAKQLAHVCAAAVLCSEISLLAAQTKPGELVKSHMILERRTKT